MADLFVSYKREDAAKVGKLVTALRESGLDVWWDEDIPGGAQWEASIEADWALAKGVQFGIAAQVVEPSSGGVFGDDTEVQARVQAGF